MRRDEFIQNVLKGIAQLPPVRQQEIMDDIYRHFIDGAQEHCDEETLCKQLGDPAQLAREYCAMYATERMTEKPSARNAWSMFWAAVGLGAVNLLLVFPLAMTIGALWISLAATGVALALGGVATALLCVVLLISPTLIAFAGSPMLGLIASIGLIALGLLLLLLAVASGKALLSALTTYIRANLAVITGRKKQ